MFDKDSFIRLIYTINVSIFITFLAIYLTTDHSEVVFTIFKAITAGIIIWFLGEVLFSLCEKLFPRNIISGYVVLFILILIGTSGFGYILGMKNLLSLLAISIIAEVFGLGITFYYRRKVTKALNDQLIYHKENI